MDLELTSETAVTFFEESKLSEPASRLHLPSHLSAHLRRCGELFMKTNKVWDKLQLESEVDYNVLEVSTVRTHAVDMRMWIVCFCRHPFVGRPPNVVAL